MLTHQPQSPEAEVQQHAIESALMETLDSGGKTAGETLVQSLEVHGYVLNRLNSLPCIWSVDLPDPNVLEVWFTGGENPVVAAVSYRVEDMPVTESRKDDEKLQAAFYSRYEELCASDTLAEKSDEYGNQMILLVAEFEADVNNGGFDQYLENKGVRKATEAVAHLETINAKNSAAWLNSALKAGIDSPQLAELDQQFYEHPEDLSVLVMRYLKKNRGK